MRLIAALLLSTLALLACSLLSPRAAVPPGPSASVESPAVTIIGVYPIEGEHEPVALVELWVTGYEGSVDFALFRQDVPSLGPAREQVAYMEHLLNESGTTGTALSLDPLVIKGKVRLAFFLHYPQYLSALQTPFGTLRLPAPTRRPKRLEFLSYEESD